VPISGGSAPAPPQFTEYSYGGNLAVNAIFQPPGKTIVMVASLPVLAQKLSIFFYTTALKKCSDSLGATETGYIGATYCDGQIGYKNDGGATTEALKLLGMTMV